MTWHDSPCFFGAIFFTGEGDWEIRGGLGVQRMPSKAEFMSMQRLELWYRHLDENSQGWKLGVWKLEVVHMDYGL